MLCAHPCSSLLILAHRLELRRAESDYKNWLFIHLRDRQNSNLTRLIAKVQPITSPRALIF